MSGLIFQARIGPGIESPSVSALSGCSMKMIGGAMGTVNAIRLTFELDSLL
jgi:hypothetical protein